MSMKISHRMITLGLFTSVSFGDLKPSPSPIVLNPGPHLFLDEFLVESSSNVVRRVNPPARNPAIANPIVTGREDQNFQPYLSVIRDDKTGRFRLWYGARTEDSNSSRSRQGYMESSDGIHWQRPHRILPFPAPIQFGVSVIDEGSNSPNAAQRFKYGWYHCCPGIERANACLSLYLQRVDSCVLV